MLLSLFVALTHAGDPDGDGVPTQVDACPKEAEDRDDWEDRDGCPDPDNDLDGVLDKHDACPSNPEDLDGESDTDGCPDIRDDWDVTRGPKPEAVLLHDYPELFDIVRSHARNCETFRNDVGAWLDTKGTAFGKALRLAEERLVVVDPQRRIRAQLAIYEKEVVSEIDVAGKACLGDAPVVEVWRRLTDTLRPLMDRYPPPPPK